MTKQEEHSGSDGATLVIPSADDRCMRGKTPVVHADGTVEIPLTRGKTAFVDAESYEMVRDKKWVAAPRADGRGYYVHGHQRVNGRSTSMSMHRVVMRAPDGIDVDHEDHDGLNNRRSNLRFATESQNAANSRKFRRRNGRLSVSKFKGVRWSWQWERWTSAITCDGELRRLGVFFTEEDAARAYDVAAVAAWGEFAWTNEKAGLLPPLVAAVSPPPSPAPENDRMALAWSEATGLSPDEVRALLGPDWLRSVA